MYGWCSGLIVQVKLFGNSCQRLADDSLRDAGNAASLINLRTG
jgi:hypothetical protein